MDKHLRIKKFVQNTLGCTCPDKVFEQIEDRQVAHASSPHMRSITIGGRLLVYIWEVRSSKKLKENLLSLLEAGRNERDECGLNRFRAVLAVDSTTHDVETEARSYFSQFAGTDDRIHLHVVSSATLKDI